MSNKYRWGVWTLCFIVAILYALCIAFIIQTDFSGHAWKGDGVKSMCIVVSVLLIFFGIFALYSIYYMSRLTIHERLLNRKTWITHHLKTWNRELLKEYGLEMRVGDMGTWLELKINPEEEKKEDDVLLRSVDTNQSPKKPNPREVLVVSQN